MNQKQNQILKKINKELRQLEEEKKGNLLSKARKNNLKAIEQIWTLSKKEKEALYAFANKIRGYRPTHRVLEQVILFAQNQPLTHMEIGAIKSDSSEEIDNYVDKSQYWEKKSVIISIDDVLSGMPGKAKQKIVFAENKEMHSIIFSIEETIYIATDSSFENYLNLLEGKRMEKWKNDEPTKIEVMQQLVEPF